MTDQMDIDDQVITDKMTKTTTTQESEHAQKADKPTKKKPSAAVRELKTCTIRSPPFAYVHLSSSSTGGHLSDQLEEEDPLDALQIRSYCTSALRQFLGDTGVATMLDILLVRERECYLRLPREDLAAFAAAITAFPGTKGSGGGGMMLLLQVRACGDWLGSLIGRVEEGVVWTCSSAGVAV
ncbi:hypothetical protein B0H66DRAFT_131143 [Apodospora peruviana]|uniref:Ribonucleases P/MRP subunit Pop8-like domain-containing protein n=1 Tax=Apodospora peruviana TaxID=516989 RepID=A0AAE0MAP4_9PEZI|nr:hypothetical protein B0H66DRAFT_131143 [Apodospora peruviana]